MKIQIVGEKITENLGFESPLRKVKIYLLTIFNMFHLMSKYQNKISKNSSIEDTQFCVNNLKMKTK